MKIKSIGLRNFRRLENIKISFEDDTTIFVGPNNSGKTSATVAFRLFLTNQDFKIHDFSVSRITELNALAGKREIQNEDVPAIEMDLWFSIDPLTEFGRVFSLITHVSKEFTVVGIRLKYCVKDAEKLIAGYKATFPFKEGEKVTKDLCHFLSLQGNMNRNFELKYYALDEDNKTIEPPPLKPGEGEKVLKSLIRVDFVDAQRNIDEQEATRSNSLSAAFASFYKKNLEQVKVNEEANKIIDANNDSLTQHYDEHFKDLMGVIQKLGVPSVNDRQLKIVSSLNSEQALRGNTDLYYVDPIHKHELPESYNGLGFKNLVFMAIQVSHFHLQWIKTVEKRPLCQIIFIEEPEVHLHAQVQQTFIKNIGQIISEASKEAGEIHMIPQLAITTHSSHILNAVEFAKVRYFQRCKLDSETLTTSTTLNASKIHSLRDFKANKKSAAGVVEDEKETLDFLKRYLKLTHCDLFFADAAILVEGAVERLLLPQMIEKSAPGLQQKYLTILEVGGAFASKFASLLEFLGIPNLIITDIDSVNSSDKKVCRADKSGALTSNTSLKFYFNIETISNLVKLKDEEKILVNKTSFIAFQKPTKIEIFKPADTMHGRTLEETFIYQNIQLFSDGKIELHPSFKKESALETQYNIIFKRVKSSSFKKTEFALDVASSTADWETPTYIAEGLLWLEKKLSNKAKKVKKL